MLTVTWGTMNLGPSKSEWVLQVEIVCKSRRQGCPLWKGQRRDLLDVRTASNTAELLSLRLTDASQATLAVEE